MGLYEGKNKSLDMRRFGKNAYAEDVAAVSPEEQAYVDGKVGDLSNLTTVNKNNLVSAINEVKNSVPECFAIRINGVGGNWSFEDETLNETVLYQHVGEQIMIIITVQGEGETEVYYAPAMVHTHAGESSSITAVGTITTATNSSLYVWQISVLGIGEGTLSIDIKEFTYQEQGE